MFGPTVGAMVSDAQRDRAVGMVAAAQGEGARLIAGGLALCSAGAFTKPTVLAGVGAEMTIAKEEVFGPVLSILSFDDDEEAISSQIQQTMDWWRACLHVTSTVPRARRGV